MPDQDPLEPHRQTPVGLFIQNASMLKQFQIIFVNLLKFEKIAVIPAGATRKEGIEKLSKALLTSDNHILIFPLVAGADSNQSKSDAWKDYLINLKARIAHTRGDEEKTLQAMSRLIPVLVEASNYQIRETFVRLFASFRIPTAFILPLPESQKMMDQIKERTPIVQEYLIEHFTGADNALDKIKAKEREMALEDQKKEADKLMAEGYKHKKNGNHEEAINCFNKAISVFPDDPEAYMESGRGYNKIKKYSRAIQRFTEAEEVAEDLPTPNQEIANVRVTQVKEMIEQGADPEDPEVAKLLNDAKSNYEKAMGKAASIKQLHDDDEVDRSGEVVSKIANSIFKLGLGEVLGSRHSFVKDVGELARGSIESNVKGGAVNIPPSQMITLGLAACDREDYDEAQRYLFKASEDKEHFIEACKEINYVGAQVRRNLGPEEAIKVYNRLLGVDPPNKAAIYFNLSAAWMNKQNEVEAAGYIVQAVYTDPTLPEEEMFYQNQDILKLLANLIGLYRQIEQNAGKFKPSAEAAAPATPAVNALHDAKYTILRKKFEENVRANKAGAIKLLFTFVQKVPDFFQSAEAYNSKLVSGLAQGAFAKFRSSTDKKIKLFAVFLAKFLKRRKEFIESTAAAGGSGPPEGVDEQQFAAYQENIAQAVSALEVADQRGASHYISKAIAGLPVAVEKSFFYENGDMVAVCREVKMKLGSVNLSKIGVAG